MRVCQRALVGIIVSAVATIGYAQTAKEGVKPDNTSVNKRDGAVAEPTADQQKENRADLDLTKKIRSSIIEDKSLSTYAHNVKVISQHGKVTLKGPVRSEDERKSIMAKAISVTGSADRVLDEMSVKP